MIQNVLRALWASLITYSSDFVQFALEHKTEMVQVQIVFIVVERVFAVVLPDPDQCQAKIPQQMRNIHFLPNFQKSEK